MEGWMFCGFKIKVKVKVRVKVGVAPQTPQCPAPPLPLPESRVQAPGGSTGITGVRTSGVRLDFHMRFVVRRTCELYGTPRL